MASIVDNEEVVGSAMFSNMLQYGKVQIDLRVLGVLQFCDLTTVMESLSEKGLKPLNLYRVSGSFDIIHSECLPRHYVLRIHLIPHASVLSKR